MSKKFLAFGLDANADGEYGEYGPWWPLWVTEWPHEGVSADAVVKSLRKRLDAQGENESYQEIAVVPVSAFTREIQEVPA